MPKFILFDRNTLAAALKLPPLYLSVLLRLLLAAAPSGTVTVQRDRLVASVDLTPSYLDLALASLVDHGFIERLPSTRDDVLVFRMAGLAPGCAPENVPFAPPV